MNETQKKYKIKLIESISCKKLSCLALMIEIEQ